MTRLTKAIKQNKAAYTQIYLGPRRDPAEACSKDARAEHTANHQGHRGYKNKLWSKPWVRVGYMVGQV